MLRLPQQVGRGQFAVAADLVRDHQRFGWPCEQVDADAAEQLPLGFGDEGVARANKHGHGGHRSGPDRHRADRLDAAQAPDFIGAGHRLRRDDCRRGFATERRRTSHHARHPRNFGGDHAHVRRGEQRVLAAGHVATRSLDRDMLVAKHHARQRFNLDVGHRGALDASEIADLRLCELDILEVLPAQLVNAILDFTWAKPVVGAVPLVEADRQITDRVIAAELDIGQDAFDGVTHFAIGAGLRLDRCPAFQILCQFPGP